MKSIILAIVGGLVTVSTIMWIVFDNQNTPDIDARMMACNNPDSAALMALYNALAGSGWLRRSGWGQDCDVCAWAGVFCDVNDRVERLLLSNNNMIGTIPVEIGLLTELTTLQMGSNQLTGVIPDEIGALTKLEHLTFSFNDLSSDLPSTLGDLLNLQFLDLGLNQLTGSLPSSLGNLSNLQFLSLSNNNISGAIPNSITNLTQLTDLAISGNALSGPIPPNIADLTNLTTLDLSNNNLNGAIPHSMGLLSGLTSLFLNQNNLSGEIPNSIGNLSNLAFLRLDFNGLSGQLPSSMGNLTLLEFLWMNNNNLEGCYPESFSTLCGTGVWLRIQNNPCFFQGTFDGFCFNPQCFFNDFFLSAPEFVCMGDTVVLWDALGSGSTYQWSTGATTDFIEVAPAVDTWYYLEAVTSQGCRRFDSAFVQVRPNVLGIFSSTDVTNVGGSDGTATVTPSGGTGLYSYFWSTNETTQTISGLSTGTYYGTVTDVNGCFASASVVIEDPVPCPVINLNLTYSNISCPGADDGFADVNPQGGQSPYAYMWSNGSTSSSVFNLAPGNLQITVTDVNGCSDTSIIFNISEPAPLISTIASSDESAPGANDGMADLSVTGGTSPYTFLWSNGATSADISGLTGSSGGTTYQVTITDDNNCQLTDQVDIFMDCFPAGTPCDDGNADTFDDQEDGNCNCAGTLCPTLILNLTATDVSCFGANDGSASVATQGGAAPHNLLWSNGSISSSIGNLGPGNYQVTITDANGCTDTSALFPMLEPAQLTSFVTGTNASTPGANDGTADLSVTGGTSPYTFLWSNGATSEDISGLTGSAGGTTYQVTITDDNNCQVTDQVDIYIDCPPAGTPCDDGNVDTFDDLEDGDCNCTGTPCPTLILNLTSTDISCFGANDGSAFVAPQGGVAPYDFLWSDGSLSSSVTNLGPGNYQVTITDANGCAGISSLFPITEPTELTTSITGTNESGPGGNDGSADLSVTGGTSPYAFLWSNGATSEDISGLTGSSGGTTYEVTITDDNSCQVTDQVDIFIDCPSAGTPCDDGNVDTFNNQEDGNCNCTGTPCPTLILNLTATDISCFGANDGSASVAPQGGSPPYDFLWSNGSISSSIGNLGPGNYQVTITDANGCAYNSGLFPIAEPAQLTSLIAGANASTPGANDGSAALSVTGGTSPYTFLWSNGATSEDIRGLQGSAGGTKYQVTITDDNNCQLTDQVDIFTDCLPAGAPCDDGNINTFDDQEDGNCDCAGTPCDTQMISMQIINNNCFGVAEGAAIVFDTVERTIEWSNGDQGPIAQNLSEGSYQVTITNGDGCSSVNAFQILSPPSIELVIAVDHASTPGGSDGKIEITIVGGVKPYKVLWNTEDSTSVINNLVAGVYYVQVEDARSCLHYDSVQVFDVPCTEYLSLLADSVTIQIDSTDNCDDLGSIHIVGVQHEGALAWSIDGGQGYQVSPLFENLTRGLYELNVQHTQNGCEGTIADVRLGPDFLSPSDLMVTHPSDCASANGSIAIDVQDGHIQISQHAEGPWFSDHITDLRSGFITIFARNIHDSCVYIVEEDLKIGNPLEASIEAVVEHANACLSGLGKISLIPNADDFTFSIDGGNNWYRNQQTFAVSPGKYQLLVQDSLGCIQDLDSEILINSVEQAPVPELQIQHTSGCEAADGSFKITSLQKPIEVSFDRGQTWTNDSIRSSLAAGTYQVWIREQGSGCLDSISLEIRGEISTIEVDSMLLSPTCFGSRDGFIRNGVIDSIDHYRYLWNTGDTLPQIGALSAGIYQLTITHKLNGCTKNFSFKLQEAPPLDLTLPSQDSLMLCQGEAYTLELADIGYQYIWYRDDYTFSSGPDLTIVGPGVYHVMAIDSQGCEARDSLLIDYSAEVFHANFLMPSQAIMGDPIKAIEISWPIPESIEWNVVGGAVISEDLNQATIQFAEPGTYSVFLQATNGQCMSTIEKIIEIVEDVNQIDPNTVFNPSSIRSAIAFPNPNIGNFNLLIELHDSSDLQVRIYSAQGILVFADQTVSTDIYSANIDLGPVVPGVYSVLIQTDLAWTSLNVVIE